MSNLTKNIVCKWTLSCGSKINNIHDIFAAFYGVTIETVLGKITGRGEIEMYNLNKDNILKQLEDYIKEKCEFSPTLSENIPILISKLHFHNDIDENLISFVAFENINNKIPTFYLCDCRHN